MAKARQRGFTLLEIVISIALLVMIIAVLMNGFGPWLTFKQKLETEQVLKDLQQATTAFYRTNHWNIVNAENAGTGGPGAFSTATGTLSTGTGPAASTIRTTCPGGSAGYDPSDTTAQEANLKPLEPYLSRSLKNVVSDGFNNVMCVLVSPRQVKMYQGAPIYYHSVAFIAPGNNTTIDENTQFVQDSDLGWVLSLGGDDAGITMDGFQVGLENYQISMNRIQRYAKSYETYFSIRYLSKKDRDYTLNYFYANDGSNNGDSGNVDSSGQPIPEVMLGWTKQVSGGWTDADVFSSVLDDIPAGASGQTNQFSAVLGISRSDSINAWGKPIYVDNRSIRVKSGVDGSGKKMQPPFSAQFGTFLPGTNTGAESTCVSTPNDAGATCPTFITSTATGQY